MRYTAILLLGPPGAGKGTQGKLLGQIPGLMHNSSGEIFRSLDPASDAGRVFAAHAGHGELVPDDVTIAVWKQHMKMLESSGRFHPDREMLILDGIPRSPKQAEMLDDTVDVVKIIALAAADAEALIARLRGRAKKENRDDDADESVIRNRLLVYEKHTAPLLRHYPPEKIAAVEATLSPIEVLLEILKIVAPIKVAFDRAA